MRLIRVSKQKVGRRCSLVDAGGPGLALLLSVLYMLEPLLLASLGSFSDKAASRRAINSECPTGHHL